MTCKRESPGEQWVRHHRSPPKLCGGRLRGWVVSAARCCKTSSLTMKWQLLMIAEPV